jgi:hypothetical protein
MPGIYGADIEQLRALAKTMSQHSDKVNTLSAELGKLLSRAPWAGRDADAFRAAWDSDHRPKLKRVAAELHNQAQELTRNADQQDKASTGATDPERSGKPDSNPPGDPGPLDPDRPDVDVPGDVRGTRMPAIPAISGRVRLATAGSWQGSARLPRPWSGTANLMNSLPTTCAPWGFRPRSGW